MKAINLVEGSLVWDEAVTPDIGPGLIRIPTELLLSIEQISLNELGHIHLPQGLAPYWVWSVLEPLRKSAMVYESVSRRFRLCSSVRRWLCGASCSARRASSPIPKGLSFIEAASLPEVYATAFLNLYIEAQAKRNEIVLVHAGASGVGTASIQLCSNFGNPCFITAGSEEKIERCIKLGAENGANRKSKHFFEILRDWSSGRGIDVILDPVGADYLESNLSLLALEGRLVLIGLMGGASAELNLGRMMQKRLRIIGSTLRARSVAAKSSVIDALESQVWPLIESGDIQPVVETVLPIQQANLAHELLATNDTFGKVVLSID
ncbi:MAG: oxidoreductase [Gammaproteobacteria bacterium]|nr:MAG: oxidoreductase [Gammaproteobacteria bacterium]